MGIVTEYSIWLIILCLILAGVYSWLLYRKDTHFVDVAKWKIKLMGAFRFIMVFFLSFLLLSPLIKSVNKYIEKPIIIFAQDNSESVIINKDSSYYQKDYMLAVNDLVKKLSANYEVKTYSFGEITVKGIPDDFKGKGTNFTNLLDEIESKYANRNVGALIIASDGIYNKGRNPIYSVTNQGYPLYTVALGDTSKQKDAILKQVVYNRIAFLGNMFPVQAVIDIKQSDADQTSLVIYKNGEIVFQKKIDTVTGDYSTTIDLQLEAQTPGLQHYKVVLNEIKGEISVKNNIKDIVIDVIDSKQKILILANSPHPDVGAIKRALEINQNYEVEAYNISKFTKNINDYNLVILHQLPSTVNSITNILAQITKSNVPVLFITGGQSAFNIIDKLGIGYRFKSSGKSFDEAQGTINQKFALFEVEKDAQVLISRAPPLFTPFGDYNTSAGAEILFYQKISNIKTSKPLIFFNQSNETKYGFICGEGIWRWRIANFQEHGNHKLFNDLINKISQYLALRVNKDDFLIHCQRIYFENEPVIFETEIYNESYELINNEDVNLDIFDSENNKYSFKFNKTNKAYRLNAGIFQTGDYTYQARTIIGGKAKSKKGAFTVVPVNIESSNTVANHQLLYQLAKQNNGKLVYPAEIAKLYNHIIDNSDITPIAYSEKQLKEIINIKWIFFILLAIVSVEWFMRKYLGSY